MPAAAAPSSIAARIRQRVRQPVSTPIRTARSTTYAPTAGGEEAGRSSRRTASPMTSAWSVRPGGTGRGTRGPSLSRVDLEAFEAVHAGEWTELDHLVRRRRLTGAETDRLVTLYQRTATHLSQVRSAAPDPVLVGRLSTLVARARGRLTGSGESAWRDVGRFVTVSCPAALYRIRWWVTAVTVASLLVMVLARLVGRQQPRGAGVAAQRGRDPPAGRGRLRELLLRVPGAPRSPPGVDEQRVDRRAVRALGVTGVWPVLVLGAERARASGSPAGSWSPTAAPTCSSA